MQLLKFNYLKKYANTNARNILKYFYDYMSIVLYNSNTAN